MQLASNNSPIAHCKIEACLALFIVKEKAYILREAIDHEIIFFIKSFHKIIYEINS